VLYSTHIHRSIEMGRPNLYVDDKVAIRDQNGIWKPAVVEETFPDRFIARWVRSAGADLVTVRDNSAIAWRKAGAPIPS
jgi:hypothetical protein